MYEKSSQIGFSSDMVGNGDRKFGLVRGTHYQILCIDENGNTKWEEEFDNLVVVAGLNDSLDKHFLASGYTAAWYVGLTDGTPTVAEGDTMASHAGWTELVNYSNATRPTLTLGTIVTGSVDNSASKASFTITGSATVGGAFLVNLPTKAQTSGTIYGAGAFTGGDRAVVAGDTLNVTVTLTATAAQQQENSFVYLHSQIGMFLFGYFRITNGKAVLQPEEPLPLPCVQRDQFR